MSLPVHLPARPAKPRTIGRTHAIDTGLGVGSIEDQLAVSGNLVDLAKLGWGTSLVTADLGAKIDTYRRHQVDVCFGGTLFELAYLQGRHLEYADWVADQGVTTIEISDGAVEFRGDDKLELIEKLASRFTVLSEVGSKDAAAIVSPARWVRAIRAELEAGADYVILEGRESGTAGLYRQTGEIRMGSSTRSSNRASPWSDWSSRRRRRPSRCGSSRPTGRGQPGKHRPLRRDPGGDAPPRAARRHPRRCARRR